MKTILAAIVIVFGIQLILASPAPEPLLNVLTNTLGSVLNLTSGLLSPAAGGGLGGLGGITGALPIGGAAPAQPAPAQPAAAQPIGGQPVGMQPMF
ncbi:unnamed protein product [Hermetia illucens]|uniref:Uncharacterized protein n=1 Tax=Hermetia illucens TaxID=343691 RepID=A0A7R8V1Z8_HERIL|nr:unnamed protein product [Hermetia illucens]